MYSSNTLFKSIVFQYVGLQGTLYILKQYTFQKCIVLICRAPGPLLCIKTRISFALVFFDFLGFWQLGWAVLTSLGWAWNLVAGPWCAAPKGCVAFKTWFVTQLHSYCFDCLLDVSFLLAPRYGHCHHDKANVNMVTQLHSDFFQGFTFLLAPRYGHCH